MIIFNAKATIQRANTTPNGSCVATKRCPQSPPPSTTPAAVYCGCAKSNALELARIGGCAHDFMLKSPLFHLNALFRVAVWFVSSLTVRSSLGLYSGGAHQQQYSHKPHIHIYTLCAHCDSSVCNSAIDDDDNALCNTLNPFFDPTVSHNE